MRTFGWIVATCLLANTAWAQCTKDTDCKGDRVCNSGECREPIESDKPRGSGTVQIARALAKARA